MKYIEGIPTKNQQKFLKMITKLDQEIFPDSIILRIPDARALEEKYEKNIREAKNNFERKKIENDYKSKQIIYDNLVQIQFSVDNFEIPFYFETVPHSLPKGTILEYTMNTVFEQSVDPIFMGRINVKKGIHLLVSPDVDKTKEFFMKLNEQLIDLFSLEKFEKGAFSITQLISVLRHDLGIKILKHEASKEESLSDELLIKLNSSRYIWSCLKQFWYRSSMNFRPVDHRKSSIHFGYIDIECIGCMLPIEDSILIQIGDFEKDQKRSPAFDLLKRIGLILMNKYQIPTS